MTTDNERKKFEAFPKGLKDAYNNEFATNAAFNQQFHSSLDNELERARQWGFEKGYQARAEQDGWLPIESAPKDGTEILAWTIDDEMQVIWRGDTEWKQWGTTYAFTPTHWMPLPQPPKQGE